MILSFPCKVIPLSFVQLSNSLITSLDIAKIASMSHSICGTSMLATSWVEMGSSRCATICVVSKLMDVKPMQASFQALNITSDFDCAFRRVLAEIDNTLDALSSKDANCFDWHDY